MGEAVQAAVTKTRPGRRARGLLRMIISTSWLSDVRNRIKRSTEKPSRRYLERAETLGWLMPNISAALPCENPRRCRTSLIAMARRTFVWRSPTSAKPKSANTLPELCTIFSFTLRAWCCHIDPHGPLWLVLSAVQQVAHPVSVSECPYATSSESGATRERPNGSGRYRRRDTCFRHDLPQPPVHRNPLPSTPSPRGVPAELSNAQSSAGTVFDRFGEPQQIPFRRAYPIQGSFAVSWRAHRGFIPVLGYDDMAA